MAAEQLDCPECGERGRLRYHDLHDRHFDAPGSWSLVECARCDLLWLHPRPAQDELDRIYESYYTHEDAEAGGLLERAIRIAIPARLMGYADARVSLGERCLGGVLGALGPFREMARRSSMGLSHAPGGTLLDVGCGDGSFLRWMAALGWQVHGVERDAKGAAVAARAFGSDRIHPDLERAGEAIPQGFDALTLSHVIEHLLEPEVLLRRCLERLKPGGTLAITTPNLESLGHERFGRSWLHLDPPRHVRLFTSESLGRLVDDAGFEVREICTPSSSAHFVWRASRMLEETGRLPGISVAGGSPVELLRSLAFWVREYRLTGRGQPRGEEVMLLACRPAP
jgi:2-polyprenyl-3-methyl-5-hydroxy-6-metoxy-1,4-benzoquinol methylase